MGVLEYNMYINNFVAYQNCMPYRKLRNATHSLNIMNMSLSLAGMYVFFLIGGRVTGVPVLCGFSSAFLHYFMLVFFTWTAVETIS